MAGAGAPFYMPALWPVSNLAYAFKATRPEKPIAPKPQATPYLDLLGNLTAFCALVPKFLLAYVVYHYTNFPLEEAKELNLGWMWPIIARDLIGTWVICYGWDWVLYMSPWAPKLKAYKFNQEYPSASQKSHDRVWTTIATLTASALEIMMLHLWASGVAKYEVTLGWQSLLWIIFTTHWRVIHFYALHRHIHPWRTTKIPDVGRFLYRHVHSLHHKSYNPTAFSGTSMHPYESTGYYSAALVPCLFGAHPIAFLICKYDCAIGAWLGHDGFQWPGSGDYFHQLHHKHFECNYGAMHVPLDQWFGTFSSGPTKRKDYSDKDFKVHPK